MAQPILTEAQRATVADAVRRAEATTSAELVCMVVRTSLPPSGLSALAFGLAGVAGLLLPYPLLLLTRLPALDIFVLQFAVVIILGVVLSQTAVQRLLWPARQLSQHVARTAHAEFHAHGLANTTARTGVLLYVSWAERRVELLADTGVMAQIPSGTWDALVADLTAQIQAGALAAGLVTAIDRCAAMLSVPFPPLSNDRNELPDLIVDD